METTQIQRQIQIICIVLRENRETAKPRLVEELRRNVLDIEDHVVKFLVVDRDLESGKRGCYTSHLRALRMLNAGIGLVLEEDCTFTRPFHLADLVKAHQNCSDPNVRNKIIYLGYNPTRAISAKDRDDQLILLHSYTTHAMIILDPVGLLAAIGGPDAPFADPIDAVYSRIAQPAIGVYPILALQRPGYSSIEDCHVDYSERMLSSAKFFHEIMYPEEVQVICMDTYPKDVRFKLRRLPITTVLPEVKFSRVIIVIDGDKVHPEWPEFCRKNKLDALFRTRSFSVAMFSARVSAMSREYYSKYSPYLTPETAGVDLFYPQFGPENMGGIGNFWLGRRGIRSQPIIMFICSDNEDLDLVEKMRPHFGDLEPIIRRHDTPSNQILTLLTHPTPDVVISFNRHPFVDATIDKDTRVYIISTCGQVPVQIEHGFGHLHPQIRQMLALTPARTHPKLLWDWVEWVARENEAGALRQSKLIKAI